MASLRTWIRFTRPFTLLPPALGVVSGAITAWGSASLMIFMRVGFAALSNSTRKR